MTTLLRWQIGANAAGAGHWATVEPENVAAPTLYFALIENRSFRTGQNSGSQFNRSIVDGTVPYGIKLTVAGAQLSKVHRVGGGFQVHDEVIGLVDSLYRQYTATLGTTQESFFWGVHPGFRARIKPVRVSDKFAANGR
jgi:hypothetical protein